MINSTINAYCRNVTVSGIFGWTLSCQRSVSELSTGTRGVVHDCWRCPCVQRGKWAQSAAAHPQADGQLAEGLCWKRYCCF
jgi:hypothetical protein